MSQQLEIDNEGLVTQFIEAWEAKDLERILSYMHEKIIFQMFEKAPEVHGIEAMRKALEPLVIGVETIRWQVKRTYSVGAIVINERVDRFESKDAEGKEKLMEFEVSGVFWMKDGKIGVWRDYMIPGGVFKM